MTKTLITEQPFSKRYQVSKGFHSHANVHVVINMIKKLRMC